MKATFTRHLALLTMAMLCLLASAAAQTTWKTEREFDRPIDDIKQAVQALRADQTAHLPTLRGFVTDNLAIGLYERPYYEFETDLVSRNSERTLLRVKARITAWYTDNARASQEYRSLTSNGRLESEFLDRVSSYLIRIDSDLVGRISSLEKMMSDLKSKTDALETRRTDLLAENERLEAAIEKQSQDLKLRVVIRPGTKILDRPSTAAHVLTIAERDDLFEIVDEQPGWVKVKVGSESTGWLPSTVTKPVSGSSDQTVLLAALKETQKPFVVTRESVTQFLGDWPSLRGKKALFLWAQPVGLTRREAPEKLAYIKQVFADRYRDAVHTDIDYSGLVIIFIGTGNKSGVAAARLDDIGQWLDGHMPDGEFLKRCSLDPPEVFRAARK